MSLISLLPLLFTLSLLHSSSSLSNSFDYSLHIDCAGHLNSTDAFHTPWLSDRFYSGGATSVVSEPLHFLHQQEKTLRYFPISSGKKNCYSIPTDAAGGRYFLRTFTVYDNFDGKSHSPSFDVSVEGTLVFSWRSPWPESVSRSGAYSDLFFYHDDTEVDLCFYSIATDSPVIGSLELIQVDTNAYPFHYANNYTTYILSDAEFRVQSASVASGSTIKAISAIKNIVNAERSPNYFPGKLYQTAITALGNGGGVLEYELPVDAKLDYLLWFHFAEIDVSVISAGQRVFDVMVNGEKVRRVDVYKEVGGFAAYDWSHVVKNLSSTTLSVRLESVVGAPVICGLENYAIVPVDLKTAPDQVVAMRALKASLRVPDRMGWNGDPCAPTTWDAWEGVTCHPTKDESALVVSQMNLSSNSLGGNIPSGLGQKSLVKLLLNDNLLGGQVPEELYSIGVHGGAIDLSGNKELCGVPSLPECPFFWGKNGLSNAGKIAIALSGLVIFSAVSLGTYYLCMRRRRNDYEFGLPHELVSLAAKRNRYQRQKSLMALEMESQHAKGYTRTYSLN
ncbi:UNVERIFIED_CONTAM: putative LRR receptor-like serine/threonine-protein kinase [Sesamum radiatum]|uniref:LRR receptor-like serine/threonine-protein kinase n=1 Tax=Sesamum radiatum TaxID=300843 RepID=A0AAW2TW55_SESRA